MDATNNDDGHENKRLKADSSTSTLNDSSIIQEDNKNQLLDDYLCPVCFEHVTPPILQCTSGHIFCEICKSQFQTPSRCPTCREELPASIIRSLPLEKMASNLGLEFSCRYQSYGCETKMLLCEKAGHEKLCELRPHKCPDIFGKCKWAGKIENIFQHLIDVHKYQNEDIKRQLPYKHLAPFIAFFGYDMTIENLTKDPQKDIRWLRITTYKDYHFLFIMARETLSVTTESPDKRMFYRSFMVLIGEPKLAEDFKIKLHLSDQSSSNRMIFEGRLHTLEEDVQSLIKNGSGLIFDSRTIKIFAKDEKLKMFVEIRYK